MCRDSELIGYNHSLGPVACYYVDFPEFSRETIALFVLLRP